MTGRCREGRQDRAEAGCIALPGDVSYRSPNAGDVGSESSGDRASRCDL